MIATSKAGHFLPPLIRDAYPRDTSKRAAIAADVPHETARNWVRGKACPSADTLLLWAARCDAMAAALERLLDDRRAARLAGPSAAAPVAPVPPGIA